MIYISTINYNILKTLCYRSETWQPSPISVHSIMFSFLFTQWSCTDVFVSYGHVCHLLCRPNLNSSIRVVSVVSVNQSKWCSFNREWSALLGIYRTILRSIQYLFMMTDCFNFISMRQNNSSWKKTNSKMRSHRETVHHVGKKPILRKTSLEKKTSRKRPRQKSLEK